MNEETPALTQAPVTNSDPAPDDRKPPRPEPAPARASGGSVWPAALAVIALAASGVLAWQVLELRGQSQGLREEVAQRVTSSESAAGELRTLVRQQQDAIAALQGKLGAVEAQVAATEGQAAALESLYQEFSRSSEDRVIAEAEQAVSMAAQQLAFAGNTEAALVALQAAEARLAAQDRGQLLPLRRALMRDIEALQATPRVDVPGIALRLEGLLENVDSLPLAFASELAEKAPPSTAETAVPAEPSPLDFARQLGRDLWQEMLTLIRVERLDQSEPVLLAPAQSGFLRENLKIRLLTARLALLARDGRTFAADLKQARNWIERFFDARDESVQKALADLAELEATPVRVEQPAPTESISALRMLQARAAEAGVKPAAPPAPAADGADAAASPAKR